MKLYCYCFAFFILFSFFDDIYAQTHKKYEPNWESLGQYECPEWFKDAKLGIFIHWGVYSVPEYGNEWYGYHMYRKKKTNHITGNESKETNPTYVHHKKTYGDPKTFGYKDFIPMFKAKKFNPDDWISLFKQAGAKYIVPVGEHCDGFAMYNASHTRWNSLQMGPKRDVLGELAIAARKKGLKVGSSSHLAFGYKWWKYEKDYDTTDPEYQDLYIKPHNYLAAPTKEFLDLFYRRSMDMIEKYKLDLMWFDFGFCAPEYEENRLKILSEYYNLADQWNKGVVLNYKKIGWEPIPDGAAVLDLERGKLDRIRDLPWQTDTSIGRNSWSYVKDWQTKPAGELIDEFVDIVSKNGNLLLNVGPKSDGTIPEDQKQVLLEIGQWLNVNGEAIYASRPWILYGEGTNRSKTGDHTEYNTKAMTEKDIRFTTKENAIYAFVMDWPTSDILIKSFSTTLTSIADQIEKVSLLGSTEDILWKRDETGLMITLPKTKPSSKYAFAFKIKLKEAPDGIYKGVKN
ncbi:alpha-L-fucosidase [Aquimarina aggregata]|uniref:alpha-L-fucosidase n=1 Tax=Aquimarina aggregata TaxID=1642818 RepID=A0A162X3V8_9FLAO|nr:alpha-L-fucosidase [Aquimarina aggregata]KZS38405.1 alpha-L-fucosidase [Aquimarina aggregata]